ncbi:hypothetical protein N7491_000948 [Penicillium cf. griseofulvum]|nr:hypothetical protein N7491_000948 [Penicillium cf. griseofulvum]
MTIESRDNYYNPLVLWVYDFFVQVLTNTFWWRCPTKSVLIPFFLKNTSQNHMEVGAGTGYFLRAKVDHERQQSPIPKLIKASSSWPRKLTIVDFHSQCLTKAVNRIASDTAVQPECVVANILEPLPLAPKNTKGRVFENLKEFLADEGVFFGSTVLSKGVKHNLIGGFLIWLYNYIGMFGNLDDGKEEILKPLRENFEEVEKAEAVVTGTEAQSEGLQEGAVGTLMVHWRKKRLADSDDDDDDDDDLINSIVLEPTF